MRVEIVETGKVKLEGGTVLEAEKFLITNNSLSKMLIQSADVKPVSKRVLVINVIQNIKFKGTLHYDRGYVYIRRIDSAEGPRVLIGGGRQWGDGESAEVEAKLIAFLREHIEGCENAEIEYN